MKTVVFSGTADGRALCEWLTAEGADVTVCVATEYGASLMKGARVRAGRLGCEEMKDVIRGCSVVIDATHPYAEKASENIASACAECGAEYLRLLREETPCPGAVLAESVRGAAEFLRDKDGYVFVSTGSKELHEFAPIGSRVRARALDTAEVRKRCGSLGLDRMIYKDPPFSYEDDIRDMRGCRWLVTKDGGRAGGTETKLRAAKALGMDVIVIKRPQEPRGGLVYGEMKRYLAERIGGAAEDEDKSGQP